MPDEIKDARAKQMLKLMYNTEFSEKRLESVNTGSANFEEFSYEEKKFLEMMDKRTQRSGQTLSTSITTKKPSEIPR